MVRSPEVSVPDVLPWDVLPWDVPLWERSLDERGFGEASACESSSRAIEKEAGSSPASEATGSGTLTETVVSSCRASSDSKRSRRFDCGGVRRNRIFQAVCQSPNHPRKNQMKPEPRGAHQRASAG